MGVPTDAPRASGFGFGGGPPPIVSRTCHLQAYRRKCGWCVGCLLVLMVSPLRAQQHSANATTQLVLVVQSRASASVPARIPFEEIGNGSRGSEVTGRATLVIDVRASRSTREILTAEWSLEQGSTIGTARRTDAVLDRILSGSRGHSQALSRIPPRPSFVSVRSRFTQEGGGPPQVAGTNLSGLGILRPGRDSAPSGDGPRWRPTQELAPNSPSALVDFPALAKSDFGLVLEISSPPWAISTSAITITLTVL